LKILSWRHIGFNVHSRVRARTKREAEPEGIYMIRPLLSLERRSLDGWTGLDGYRFWKEARETERMDHLEFNV
jgi:hypothetical protein